MLTPEQNHTLTRIGPGTRMGNLLCHYWFPIAATAQLNDEQVKAVKLLGENLVLYRDKRGEIGLLAEACPHRGASLAYGILEEEGLRCPYHGWLYDARGQCVEQPLEPLDSVFKDQIRTTAYSARELGGLIFAYLGPQPAPELPRYGNLVWDDALREINGTVIACNWLQVMENLLDPYHVESLHGRYFEYVLRLKGGNQVEEFLGHYAPRPMKRTAFDLFENGILERHMYTSEEEASWKEGAPTFFPTTTLVGTVESSRVIYYVVPLDDTHTWLVVYMAARMGDAFPGQGAPPFCDVPGVDDSGRFRLDTANGQDHMAVVTQGDIAPREGERPGISDSGIVLYRQLLMEELVRFESGGSPMNRLRGKAEGVVPWRPPFRAAAAGGSVV